MNYITDAFLDRTNIKNFRNIFSTSLSCRYNLIYVPFVVAAGILYTKSCVFFRFFSFFFFLYLCHIDRGNFVLPRKAVFQKQPLEVEVPSGLRLYYKGTPSQVLSNFEEHLRTTASSSSSFKLRCSRFICMSKFKFETGKN